jgi:hypothetical protein
MNIKKIMIGGRCSAAALACRLQREKYSYVRKKIPV